ncbi:hypothetical protein E2C01_023282 [Portunus trituberculatus]|uniref:Uncharacterized protein n=1 Tax=Portunus trituberculatus TaxID=210409 RepID=A0A5B7E8E1_PORTR|nr:hypothetical protein [Portunus trituberculatus]
MPLLKTNEAPESTWTHLGAFHLSFTPSLVFLRRLYKFMLTCIFSPFTTALPASFIRNPLLY